MTPPNETTFVLLIQTNSYAGNYERQVCAHVTGQVGYCGVGSRYVDEEIAEIFEDKLNWFPDDRGCLRPCTMWQGNKVKFGNSLTDWSQIAIFFQEHPNVDELKVIKERLKTFKAEFDETPKFLSLSIIKYTVVPIVRELYYEVL